MNHKYIVATAFAIALIGFSVPQQSVFAARGDGHTEGRDQRSYDFSSRYTGRGSDSTWYNKEDDEGDNDSSGKQKKSDEDSAWGRHTDDAKVDDTKVGHSRQDRLNDRLDRTHDRIQKRLDAFQERICTRLERLQGRLGTGIYLPDFCTDNGGGNGGGGYHNPTLSFTASPMSIQSGATSTLTWDSTYADSCTASDGWTGDKAVDGSMDVAPTQTTSYTLTCERNGKEVTKSTTVTVTDTAPAPSVDLTVDDSTLDEGATTTLSWTSMNATSCLASNGWSGARATSGSLVIGPDTTTTYTLACGNGTATATDSVVVSVNETIPAPTVSLTSDQESVVAGATSTLSWSTGYADTCMAENGWSGAQATSGSAVVTVNATTTYTLRCENATGSTTDSVTIDVVPAPTPAPTADLSASKTSVEENGTTTLTWSSTNATACIASGGAGFTGATSTSGSRVVMVGATTTYDIACGNGTATSTDSVTVNVVPAPSVANTVVLSEVLYDLANDGSQGSETSGKNEWLEIYNGTAGTVDFNGWYLVDAGGSTSTIATTSTPVASGGYLLVLNSTTTADFWSIPASTTVVVLGDGEKMSLTNGADSIRLFNSTDDDVDAVGWEGNQDAFDSTGLAAPAGSSIARVPVTTDTGSVDDWEVSTPPTPGA